MEREPPTERRSPHGQARRVVEAQPIVRVDVVRFSCIRHIAGQPVASVAAWMRKCPRETLERLKHELRGIFLHDHKELMLLQHHVLNRIDLMNRDTLMGAHRVQLEILVAIKTRIQAFLHMKLSVTQSTLVEVFLSNRCHNMVCQQRLPANNCVCHLCLPRQGFCNACMCTICKKFDFRVNTYKWIGCDFCSHWVHTDCALQFNRIAMATPKTNNSHNQNNHRMEELSLCCHICNNVNELFGWVKDVFYTCAADWGCECVTKELNYVLCIFRLSEDPKGKQLFWKVEELLSRLKEGADSSVLSKELQQFFQDLEGEDRNRVEAGDINAMYPRDSCEQIAKTVHEAITKMEATAKERACALKWAHLAFEASDAEVEERRRELARIQMERQQKKQEIEDLETIVKLKQAKADVYQKCADDLQKEAENLQSIIATESEKVKED